MFQPTALFIGLRYSRSRKGSAFTAFINRFALAGIAIGVFALIIVTAVMNGFENELKNRILGVVPQLTVTNDEPRGMSNWQAASEALNESPELASSQITEISPYVATQGVLQVGQTLQPVAVQGVFAEQTYLTNAVAEHLVMGDMADLHEGSYGVFIGQPLAYQLNLRLGDEVRIIAAAGGVYTPLGLMPAQRKFRVQGIFFMESEVDTQMLLVNGVDAARLLRLAPDAVSGLRFYLTDPFSAPAVGEELKNLPYVQEPGWQVGDWRAQYGQLFEAVAMEKRMMWMMLALIIAVAAFNIVSGLMLIIQDKRRDIAILQTMGARAATIYRVFLVQGLYNGVIGAVVGLVLGLLCAYNLNDLLAFLQLNEQLLSGQELPVLVQLPQVAWILAGAIGLALVATFYPAARAAKTEPSEALRCD